MQKTHISSVEQFFSEDQDLVSPVPNTTIAQMSGASSHHVYRHQPEVMLSARTALVSLGWQQAGHLLLLPSGPWTAIVVASFSRTRLQTNTLVVKGWGSAPTRPTTTMAEGSSTWYLCSKGCVPLVVSLLSPWGYNGGGAGGGVCACGEGGGRGWLTQIVDDTKYDELLRFNEVHVGS